MKTVAVVPMKLNNRRLPQKNTKPFTNGKPLCWYILSTLLKVQGVEEVYVYCSNPEIQEFLPEGVKYLRRGEDLDQDTTKMNEVLQRFAADVPADVYVMTHTTAPFIQAETIQKGLDAVLSGEYDSAFAVKELRDFLWKDGKNNRSEIVKEGRPGAKKAVLHYRVLKCVDNLEMLEIRLETGRHHQIRVQMAGMGTPLVGDRKYGKVENYVDNVDNSFPALCAYRIKFRHPTTGKWMEFERKPENPVFQKFM